MRILLHICCGPCAAYPLQRLRGLGHGVFGLFYNPNIHPFKEFQRRLAALDVLAERVELAAEMVRDYGLVEYLREVVFREQERCALCYAMRLSYAARLAAARDFDAFTTTLLYSRYQNHALIRAVGERLADEHGVPFYYEDFRSGWDEGIAMAKELELYRQPYCGCIYSEQERYDRRCAAKGAAARREGTTQRRDG